MKSFPRRRLGKTSVQPTSIGIGTGALGGFGVAVDYQLFEQTILAAFNNGVRYFDTAPMYGYGKSEHYLGHAIRTLGLRNEVTLSTKVGRILKSAGRSPPAPPAYGVGWVDSLPFRDTFDYSYDGIMRSFEDSQQRLGLDHFDILFVHDIGRAWHGEAAALYWRQLRDSGYRALEELRAAGATGAIGLGVNETESVLEAAKEFSLDCALIAGRYTLLNHTPLNGAFAELQRRNVSVIAAGVFNSGILAAGARGTAPAYDYRIAPPDIMERVRRIEEICDRHRVALPAAAVQFVYAHPAVSAVLLGAENPAEVEHNVAAVSVRIPEAFWAELKSEGIIPEDSPTTPLGRSNTSSEPPWPRP
jgi:D-threo-aldose 1-dehydrogenase